MKNTKVVFMGTPDFAVPILEGLIENYTVVLVVSQPDRRVGRKQELVNTPTKEVALKNNIPVFQPEKIRNDYQTVLDYDADIIVTCAYGQIIPKEILDAPRLGCINVHGSLLPKLRGGAPIHWAIINGEKKTGMTIMYMDVKMDSGDIISQRETEILDSDNLESLYDRMSLIGRDLLLDTMPSIIEGTNSRTKQNEEEVTFGFNVKREEEHIDFNKSCKEVFNLIRGLSPIPGAYAVLDDSEMKVYAAVISDKNPNGKCGEITNTYKNGIGVSCSDGDIILTDIKPFGKKRMDAGSYLNGVDKKSLIGKVFE